MHSVNLTISRIYQFIGEGIFLYLLIIPFYLPSGEIGPVWSYLAVIAASSLLLLFSERISTYAPVIALATLIGIFFWHGLQFPLILALAMANFIAWRWIIHLKHGDLENEKVIVSLTIAIGILEYVFTGERVPILLAVIQFGMIIFGYMLKHLTMIPKTSSENRFSLSKVPLIFTGLVIVLGILIYFIFEPIKYGFSVLAGFVLITAGWLANQIYQLIGLDEYENEPSPNNQNMDIQIDDLKDPVPENQETSGLAEAAQTIADYSSLLGAALIVMFVIAVFYYFYRKRISIYISSPDRSGSIIREFFPGGRDSASQRKRGLFLRKFRQKPDHLVRKLFYEFEHFTREQGLGRFYSETIEEWFQRIGLAPESVCTYQKVRYGAQSLSDEEIENFRQNLEELKTQVLSQKEDNSH